MTLLGLLLLPALVLVFNLIIHNAESKLQPEELLATLQASLEVNLVPSLALQLPVLSYSRALRAQGMASESTSAGWVVTNVYYGSSCGTGIGVFSAGVVTNVCMAVTAENVTTSVIVSCDSSKPRCSTSRFRWGHAVYVCLLFCLPIPSFDSGSILTLFPLRLG